MQEIVHRLAGDRNLSYLESRSRILSSLAAPATIRIFCERSALTTSHKGSLHGYKPDAENNYRNAISGGSR